MLSWVVIAHLLSCGSLDFFMCDTSASFFEGYIRWYENVDGKGYEWRNHTVYVGTQGHYVSHGDMDGGESAWMLVEFSQKQTPADCCLQMVMMT